MGLLLLAVRSDGVRKELRHDSIGVGVAVFVLYEVDVENWRIK